MISETMAQLQPCHEAAECRRSILIVDDDPQQVEALAFHLHKQGFATFSAHEGKNGLDLARQHRPDLILLDLQLPDIDGFVVCEELVDSPETADIPIIIITGAERSNVVRSSRAAGCEFFLRKPFDPNALLLLIQNAMRRNEDWTI